jgi:molecular chaperone DnaK (HSP70)
MVVDCGGGTVDITVHEMENESGNLKELYKATGGPFGSTGASTEN